MKLLSATTTLLIALLVLINPLTVSAVSMDPSSGTKQSNTESIITIRPNAVTGEAGVKLRLQVTNAQIISFTEGVTFLGIGQCSGSTKFTSTEICVDLAKSSDINNSTDILGTMRVRWGNVGSSSITAITGNAYSTTTSDRADVGVKGTYTIGNIPNTPLISAETDKYLLIVGGAGMIVFGAYLRKNSQLGTKETYGY